MAEPARADFEHAALGVTRQKVDIAQLESQPDGVDDALTRLRLEASGLDSSDADPSAVVAPLIQARLFRATPPAPDGRGLATDRAQTMELYHVLRRIGGANLSAGRLFEGHVNAVKLVFAFGTAAQKIEIAEAVAYGALMGVWNAEAPPGLRLSGQQGERVLQGSKIYASGAGLLARPLVTARDEKDQVWMVLPKAAARAPFDLSDWRMRGMRATATGTVNFDGLSVEEDEIIGGPGDYYRSPGFRGGAWRFAAVQFGAIEEIGRLLAIGMKARGRAADPHQKARMGRAAIAVETARLWTMRAAEVVERGEHSPEDADAYAGMARLVVERTALEVIELAERALGLMAFAEAEPIERIVRDLSTYLRQPFPDAVLDEIGGWALDT